MKVIEKITDFIFSTCFEKVEVKKDVLTVCRKNLEKPIKRDKGEKKFMKKLLQCDEFKERSELFDDSEKIFKDKNCANCQKDILCGYCKKYRKFIKKFNR